MIDDSDSEDDDDDGGEPIGSCDDCQADVYEDEVHRIDGALLCDTCAWWLRLARKVYEP